MCNFCNSGTCGCRCTTSTARTVNSCNYGLQRLCRDACGNIRVTQCGSCCGCNLGNSCNSCNNGCGCNCGCGDNTASNNGNGGYACVTVCGNTTASTGNRNTASNSTDWYYARQYGLLPYGSCPCSAGYNYNYNTTTQTT